MLDRLIACFFLCLCAISYFCNLWILYIVCFPPIVYLWICVLYSTHFLRNTPFWEEHILYRPSKFFRPFWQSMPKGEKVRRFCLRRFMLWFFLKHLPSCSCIFSLHD